MNRLRIHVYIGLMLLVGSCGTQTWQQSGTDQSSRALQQGLTNTQENAALASTTAMPLDTYALLLPAADAPVEYLPPLPLDSLSNKHPFALEETWKNGSESHEASANVQNIDDSIGLSAGNNEISWAVYQFPVLAGGAELKTLHIEASAPSFNETDPGYWVGIANYDLNRWQTLSGTVSLDYARMLPATAPFSSPGDNVYVFILIGYGQSLTIDRVGIGVEREGWAVVELDAGPNAGWTPAVAFAKNGNPLVVYSDYSSGKAELLIGSRATDLSQVSNWEHSDVEPLPDGIAKWLDVAVDQVGGMPRVSMIYSELTGEEENSRIGLSVLAEPAGSPLWLNYRIKYIDGAEYTCIAQVPGAETDVYAIVNHAVNESTPEQPAYDMHYRIADLGDPNNAEEISVNLTRNFATLWDHECRNPQVRFDPVTTHTFFCANGGYSYEYYYDSDQGSNVSVAYLADVNALCFGSIAFDGTSGKPGQSFSHVSGAQHELVMFNDLTDPLAQEHSIEDVQSIGTFQAGVSQLAYLPDGTPALAYTAMEGASIYTHYAYLDGTEWVTENLSNEASSPTNPEDLVIVDFAVFSDGAMVACWNHLEGSECSLYVALRGM